MATQIRLSLTAMQTPIRSILIYNGPGVYGESVTKLMRLFGYVKGPWKIAEIGEKEVVPDKWTPAETLFILPGGKAGEYDEHLGEQVQKLKRFVIEGGLFFSVCGGSYFASKRTVYQLSTQECLDKTRELCFFNGVAQGPLIPSDTDDISFHHGALQVRWKDTARKAPVLISGGGAFIPNEATTGHEVLVSYEDPLIPKKLSAAVVKCRIGKGRAILSSLHLGYHASDIDVPVYKKYFPAHDWEQIVASLEGTEEFRVQCFADLLLSLTD
ncbi:BPL-N domain-containing protein [Simkania sp.]|uniref:BPL-N domain-containing protein n=1 Tax=Simkania sp. TaxID=34094 RepID=UPI003B529C82